MDDGLRLIFLLMAGVLPLMAMRDRLSAKKFRLLVIAYVVVAAVAIAAFVTRGAPWERPQPDPASLQRV